MNNPELWEMLGLQALHRSDYLFAAEMLAKAAAVSPIKRRLLHALAEVYCALGQQERALPLAEKVPNAVSLLSPRIYTSVLPDVPPCVMCRRCRCSRIPPSSATSCFSSRRTRTPSGSATWVCRTASRRRGRY